MRQSGFVRRMLSFAVAFSIIALCITALSPSALADTSYSLDSGDNSVGVKIPSGFTVLTAADIDRPVEYFRDFPIDKNEASVRFKSGVLLDAFSADRTREIRISVFDSSDIGKYAAPALSTASGRQSETSGQDLVSGINNFSALSAADRKVVITAVCDNLTAEGHSFLSTPAEVELSGYTFIKTYARIGSSVNGYTYSSVMTIIGGKCYELTCFDNLPTLQQEQIDANEEVLGSLKLSIRGDSGELAANHFQSFIAFAVILIAIAVIAGVIISFVKPYITGQRRDDEVIARRK